MIYRQVKSPQTLIFVPYIFPIEMQKVHLYSIISPTAQFFLNISSFFLSIGHPLKFYKVSLIQFIDKNVEEPGPRELSGSPFHISLHFEMESQ